jgi:hypothetical protein
VPTMSPSSSSSLSSPGRTDDSPSLNKAILPHPIHVFCLDFFHLKHKNEDLLITDCTSTSTKERDSLGDNSLQD